MNEAWETFTLPGAEEMLERLKRVYDDPYLESEIYPIFAKHAGSQVNADMLVTLLLHALAHPRAEDVSPGIWRVFLSQMPEFIDALAPDARAVDAGLPERRCWLF